MKQTDIYTEALICMKSILQADYSEFKNWIDWLERDIQDWIQYREVAHHLRAYGGMGSFNDLPSMRGNHDYIFRFLKSFCYAFGHLYGIVRSPIIFEHMEEWDLSMTCLVCVEIMTTSFVFSSHFVMLLVIFMAKGKEFLQRY